MLTRDTNTACMVDHGWPEVSCDQTIFEVVAVSIIGQFKARFKEPVGLVYHGLAFTYAGLGYVLGVFGLFAGDLGINIVSTLLLGHAMTIAAYLIHECGHNTVFKDNKDNARLGTFLTWLCGASYGTYEDIRYKHFRHHVDNDDVVWFDYEKLFRENTLLYKTVCVLEWFYIPAHELVMHGLMAFTSFIVPARRDQRRHNLVSLIVRGGLYGFLIFFFPKVALLYAIAYVIMMTILRFVDGLEHDYGYHTNLFEGPISENKGDAVWEQEHTFSPIISWNYEWANWIILNFGYHNAHHAKPTAPWYRLPKLHRELFGDDSGNVILLWPQLVMFHRCRVSRIMHTDMGDDAPYGRPYLYAAQRAEVDGGNAASFLTSF
ncbi:MAG: omega-6 fatty acid desaturase (delta-12 desaturase) [Halieaceae bacterium]